MKAVQKYIMYSKLEINRNHSLSVSDQIYGQFRQMIISGDLPIGERIPPLRQLQDKLEVGISTIRNAFDRLERQGLIIRKPHLGTFVEHPPLLTTLANNETTAVGASHGMRVAVLVVNDVFTNRRMTNFIEEFEFNINTYGGKCSIIKYDSTQINDEGLWQRLKELDSILYVCDSRMNDAFLKTIQDLNKPIVAYNYQGHLKVARVSEDWDWAMRLLVNHLIDLGHRKIALASFYVPGVDLPWIDTREASFIQMAELENLPVGEDDIYRFSTPQQCSLELVGEDFFDVFLTKSKDYTAIIGINDTLAMDIYKNAVKAGFEIPKDFSLAGFDNIIEGQDIGLTTIAHSSRDDGKSAAELLIEQYQSPHGKKIVHIMNKPNILQRESTAGISK